MMRILCLLEVDNLDVIWLIFTLLEILMIYLIELPKEVQKLCRKEHGWRTPYRTAERSAEVMSSFPVLRFGVGFLLSHNE